MKEVFKATLLSGDFGVWPTISLVIFTLVMLGVIGWVLRPGTKEYYRDICRDMLKGE